MTSSQPQSTTVDSLPKQFVVAMRTLFDIMDDKKTGLVNFADIEHRWQDDGTKGLPKGVIESLQKVTPPNGMLSFERFCAGLKICLLRNQVELRAGKQRPPEAQTNNRPPSAPLLDLDGPTKTPWNGTTAVRPNNAMPQQRTISMPQLLADQKDIDHGFEEKPPIAQNVAKPLYGPPKPPRTGAAFDRPFAIPHERNLDRAEIRTALQNWQIGQILNDQEKDKRAAGFPGALVQVGRGAGDGKPSVGPIDMQLVLYQKKAGNAKRREPRRHTLQNGIDYNMLKRMKQIEQEKDVLAQGLQAVERAREWYLKQVAAVQDKMKYLGRMGSHMEQWTEAQQERLELQRARVLEVNRHLAMLTDSWERGGLPLHMNLALYHNPYSQDIISRLRQQNHILTEEVNKKGERIAILEREKASLIREILQNRNNLRNNVQEEAVF